jgi:hypothetical protein
MRAEFVVMAAPALDDRLGLCPRPESFETQTLVAELAVEAFGDTILPRLAGLDQRRVDALHDDPGQERLRAAEPWARTALLPALGDARD